MATFSTVLLPVEFCVREGAIASVHVSPLVFDEAHHEEHYDVPSGTACALWKPWVDTCWLADWRTRVIPKFWRSDRTDASNVTDATDATNVINATSASKGARSNVTIDGVGRAGAREGADATVGAHAIVYVGLLRTPLAADGFVGKFVAATHNELWLSLGSTVTTDDTTMPRALVKTPTDVPVVHLTKPAVGRALRVVPAYKPVKMNVLDEHVIDDDNDDMRVDNGGDTIGDDDDDKDDDNADDDEEEDDRCSMDDDSVGVAAKGISSDADADADEEVYIADTDRDANEFAGDESDGAEGAADESWERAGATTDKFATGLPSPSDVRTPSPLSDILLQSMQPAGSPRCIVAGVLLQHDQAGADDASSLAISVCAGGAVVHNTDALELLSDAALTRGHVVD